VDYVDRDEEQVQVISRKESLRSNEGDEAFRLDSLAIGDASLDLYGKRCRGSATVEDKVDAFVIDKRSRRRLAGCAATSRRWRSSRP
jgi:hypothetical protein